MNNKINELKIMLDQVSVKNKDGKNIKNNLLMALNLNESLLNHYKNNEDIKKEIDYKIQQIYNKTRLSLYNPELDHLNINLIYNGNFNR